MGRPFVVAVAAASLCLTAHAASLATPDGAGALYVCKDTGDNKNDGTKEKPFKEIDKAVKSAKAGQSILVCAGRYSGTFDIGFVEVDKPVQLYGGYTSDFSARDPFKNLTLVQPDNASGAKSRKALMAFKKDVKGVVVDGFVFDMGQRNSYSSKEGIVAGVDKGMLLLPPQKDGDDKPTVTEQCLYFETGAKGGDVTITNNIFANCASYAIQGGLREGKYTITNNVFVAPRMAAVEVYGTCKPGKEGKSGTTCGELEFANNTVLFAWSRTKELKDMGYGIRVMTGIAFNVHHNIFGGNVLGGIDHTRFSTSEFKLDDNLFFGNKEADVYFSPASNTQLRLRVEQFGDLEWTSVKNNAATLPKGYPVDTAYLEGFLAARYSEKADFDRDSPANQMRVAFGLNPQGKLTSKVSMYGNRYDVQKAAKLFGGVADVGAQLAR